MELKHKKVTETYYSVVLRSSNRGMPEKINEFFSGFDFKSLDDDVWSECTTELRDYDGDYEGIEIYPDNRLNPVFEYISDALEVDPIEFVGISIKITCI